MVGGRDGAHARPANEAKRKVKQELKRITRRNRGISLTRMFKEINQKMRGWLQYYSICQMRSFIQRLDQWLRSRIRQYIWKQWKKFKTKVANLQKLGLSKTVQYPLGLTLEIIKVSVLGGILYCKLFNY